MRLTSTILLLLSLGSLVAQTTFVPLDRFSTWTVERQLDTSASDFHPEIKPYSAWSVESVGIRMSNRGGIMDRIGEKQEVNGSYAEVCPRVNATGFYQSGSSKSFSLESHIGAGVYAGYKGKLMLNGDILAGYNEPVKYIDKITDSLNMVPGFGPANRQGGYGFNQSTFSLSWKPGRLVELHAGRGKHFIGEGYRSLFLSDYASNYNYMRTDVSVWRIKYMVLFTQMKSAQGYPQKIDPKINKYSTMHYLSLNITKWWSVGAFEAVVWESEDSVQNRQLDINYFNPIIFFRPIEYSIGSSDNSLLGFSSTIRPIKGLTLYGQLMLDEFYWQDVVAPIYARINPDSAIGTGSWRNKQSMQLGIKIHNLADWKNSTIIAEMNVVRPYMYSHGNSNQNYMNFTQPLAHPLGSNFIEWLTFVAWQPARNWGFLWSATYSRKGYSTITKQAGEDPNISSAYLSNATEFGYYQLQGKLIDVANIRLQASYTIIHSWNLRAEASVHYRLERTNSSVNEVVMLSLGLRTAMWNEYRNL